MAPRRSTSTFKLTLRRFCVPLYAVHIAPKLPHPRHVRPTTAMPSGEKWDGPQIPINLQVSDELTMRQRVRRQIDLGQLRTIDMRVDLRGRYIGMSQDLL